MANPTMDEGSDSLGAPFVGVDTRVDIRGMELDQSAG